jgi:DegV family protein with EDD domain
MEKIGIVLDSSCSIQPDQIEKYQIESVPLQIIVDGTTYYDRVDTDTKTVLDAIDAKKKVTTSQPAPEMFAQAYRNMKDKGFTHLFVVTISAALSGTYQSATIAADMVEDIKVAVIDSKSSSMINDLIYYFIDKGVEAKTKFETLVNHVRAEVDRMRSVLTVNNLETLFKSGRLTRTQAFIGNVLQVKPMIGTTAEGKMELIDRIRSTKKAMGYLVAKVSETIEQGMKPMVSIGHIFAPDKLALIRETLLSAFPNAVLINAREISPVIAVHLGNGGYGICWTTIPE